MFISNGGVGVCIVISCLHCQHYHCLYPDKDVDYVASDIVDMVVV